MEIDCDKMKNYSERARASFSEVIEAMNKLAEVIKKVAEDLMICDMGFFNIQRISISTERRERADRKWMLKAEIKPKQKRFQPKKTWFRTRSNPFNKRGGQRARDKPVKQPKPSERK